MLITLPDGRTFPSLDGVTPLSWPIGCHYTFAENKLGYPKIKEVLHHMTDEDLARDLHQTTKDSLSAMWGRVNEDMLALIRAEILTRKTL